MGGAGMFATSLGPDDACFVAGANWEKNSGYMVTWASVAAVQKEIIEATITDEAQYGLIGRLIWHFVHHTPVHLFGWPSFGLHMVSVRARLKICWMGIRLLEL